MTKQVCAGAKLQCAFGNSPSILQLVPPLQVQSQQRQTATVQDSQPIVNIQSFGMCSSLSNPQVAAATSAAQGVLTPQPCLPAPAGPWQPGSITVRISGQPALTMNSTCQCNWGGVVSISESGQQSVNAK